MIPGIHSGRSYAQTTNTMPSVILDIDTVPKFAFLALPPPPKKKHASVNDTFRAPPPPANRSNTILAWAETVHPGSPAPMTPGSGVSLPRSASLISSPLLHAFRRSSLTRAGSRRRSVSSTRSRIPSASFLQFVDAPRTPAHPIPATPFPTDAKFDFTAFGYASIFVDVPVSTPITPDIYKPKPMTRLPSRHDAVSGSAPTTPVTKSTGMFKRLLGNKPKATKSRANVQAKGGKAGETVADYVSVSLQKRAKYTEQPSCVIEKKKREVYAAALPPTVKQEAQMRQAMEGGSLEHSIRKVMEEKAKREGTAVKVNVIEGTKVVEGVEAAHRDGQGGIWWNQEEEWEFAHLLAANKVPLSARYPDAEGWVTFNHLKEFEKDDFSELSSLPSSKYTDLYHSRPLLVTDEAAERLVRHGHIERCSSVAGSIVFPSPSVKPSNILLAVPSRPNRARHLQPGFLKDVIAVPPTPSTPSAFSHTSSRPPRSPARATRFIIHASATPGPVRRQRSRSRSLPRRQRKPAPPPLKIVPICPVNKMAVNVDPEEEDRKMFLEDSFKPGPIAVTSQWSRETTPSRLLPASSGDSGNQTNDFAFVDLPKKSRRLGGFFKKGERKC